MVCEIHLHQEVKVRGKWYHHAECPIKRRYWLFALMADVTNFCYANYISKPRGLPEDISEYTNFCYWHSVERDKGIHSPSYLTAEEITKLKERAVVHSIQTGTSCIVNHGWFEDVFGYFLGNPWTNFVKNCPEGVEDVRFVFWFDS